MSQTTSPIGNAVDTGRIDTDERLRILAHERRRIVLSLLERRSVPIELSELAEEVVELEKNTEPRDRVSLTLHHRHLPMMADSGAIRYDADERRITAIRAKLLEDI